MNAADILRRHAALTPDAPAFIGAAGAVASYASFDACVDAAAHRLHERDIAPGQVVVPVSGNLYRYLVTAFALGRIGAAFGPPVLPPEKVSAVVLDAGFTVDNAPRTIAMDEIVPAPGDMPVTSGPYPSYPDSAALFSIFASSGTTKGPRFTPVSHELSLIRSDVRALAFASMPGGRRGAAARQACLLPPSSSYGFSSAALTLRTGGTVMEPRVDPSRFAAWIAESGLEYLVLSPGMLAKYVEAMPDPPLRNALAAVEVGGGAVSPGLRALAQRRLCANIIVSYGTTETGRIAWAPPARFDGLADTGGMPLPGVTVEIVDEDDVPLPQGETGIVRIRSARNADHYFDDPEASARVFRNGWVYPGDRGHLEPDGFLRLSGRVDDVLNRGGHKFDPEAVESALVGMFDVREAALFGFADPTGVTRICAAIVAGPGYDAAPFLAACREKLGAAAPEFAMQVAALPRNENGKIVRRTLAEAASALYARQAAAH